MKKKMISGVLVLTMALSMVSAVSFAETSEETLETVGELKTALQEVSSDGEITQSEREQLLDNASDEAIEGLMFEKLDYAAEALGEEGLELYNQEAAYIFDLGDGCQMRVKLEDRAEPVAFQNGIMPFATSGSSTMWKEYGNRYFTATATVDCGASEVTFILRNHYTLSVRGIDERRGDPETGCENARIIRTHGIPKIDTGHAGSIGASTKISCEFSCEGITIDVQEYRMDTKVKYLEHNKAGKKIRVGQSWNLVKTS